jgi:branched-chain amino acid transport system substrate-binding protein
LNKREVTGVHFQTYTPGKSDYSAEIAELQAADIAVFHVGGYPTEVALMAREARDHGYSVQFVSGDVIATEEFGLIAGPAADGTLFIFSADPHRNPEAASVVEQFRAKNFETSGYSLSSYAAVQVRAQPIKNTDSLQLQEVIAALCDIQIETLVGPVDFDDKGELTVQDWIWNGSSGGEYAPLQ